MKDLETSEKEKKWLKVGVNTHEDRKIMKLEDEVGIGIGYKIWVTFMSLAKKSKREGIIEIDTGVPYEIEDLAYFIRVNDETIVKAISCMLRLRLVTPQSDGTLAITNWRKWQKESIFVQKAVEKYCKTLEYDRERKSKTDKQDEEQPKYGLRGW